MVDSFKGDAYTILSQKRNEKKLLTNTFRFMLPFFWYCLFVGCICAYLTYTNKRW